MTLLTGSLDGTQAIDLGIVGGFQYALRYARVGDGFVFTDVARRPKAHAATYGGWRSECSPEIAIALRPDIADLVRAARVQFLSTYGH